MCARSKQINWACTSPTTSSSTTLLRYVRNTLEHNVSRPHFLRSSSTGSTTKVGKQDERTRNSTETNGKIIILPNPFFQLPFLIYSIYPLTYYTFTSQFDQIATKIPGKPEHVLNSQTRRNLQLKNVITFPAKICTNIL